MGSKHYLLRYAASFSHLGLIFAAVFLSISLGPSLLPRNYLTQGVLSGIAFGVGYGFGASLVLLWRYLELPELQGKLRRLLTLIVGLGTAILTGVFFWRMTLWQNSIRELMDMELLTTAHPWRVGIIAVCVAVLTVAATRLLYRAYRLTAEKLDKFVPRRVANVLGITIVFIALLSLIDGLLIKNTLRLTDDLFAKLDVLVDEGIEQPHESHVTGSQQSLVPWNTIGRRGREFIVTGPSQSQISQFTGREALQPIRVYVGLGLHDTPEERAGLALEELKRVGAFGRSLLIIATPTGTGWLDPGGVDTVEYLHGGDTAIVSMQYSYLPSWLTILIDPDRSRVAANILFDEIYDYWTTLPESSRPRLYLHGLSLGALGSEASTSLHLVLGDLLHGAVWSGPPFPSTIWSAVTKDRNPDSPPWLPHFRDGSFIRFTNQKNALNLPEAHWGPIRIVYIQHASDPMSLFSPDLLFRKPDWLGENRGPDVSPYFQWYPIITFLQIAFDLPMATSVPIGYGHNFSPSAYIDAWVEVTAPEGWTEEDTTHLKRIFEN